MDIAQIGSQALPFFIAAIGAALMRQVVGRLMRIGLFLGLVLIVLQAMFPDQFVHQTIAEAIQTAWAYVSNHPVWHQISGLLARLPSLQP